MTATILNALVTAGVRAGILDTRFALAADLNGISVDNDGTVVGADAAIARLRFQHPNLFIDFAQDVA